MPDERLHEEFKRRIKTRPCCLPRKLPRCCSGPCWLLARSRCARWKVGKASPRSLPIEGLVTSAAGLPSLTYSRTIRDDQISLAAIAFRPKSSSTRSWLYIRFTLSFRDVEDLLAERGIMVAYEPVRRWVNHFGPTVAVDLRKRHPNLIRLGIWTKSI
jgi:hypothetical protein